MATAGSSDLRTADLPPQAYDEAIGVLARGMRDNPVHLAAYGPDPDRRERIHAKLMRGFFKHVSHNEPIGVWRGDTLVAVSGVLHEHACRPGVKQSLAFLPVIASLGPRTAGRVGNWFRIWGSHDPDEPHAHLGPVAVDRHLQGQGIGSVMLREHARRLDERGLLGYLETDKRENVGFYEKVGYRVTGEAPVLGVPTWLMRREPA